MKPESHGAEHSHVSASQSSPASTHRSRATSAAVDAPVVIGSVGADRTDAPICRGRADGCAHGACRGYSRGTAETGPIRSSSAFLRVLWRPRPRGRREQARVERGGGVGGGTALTATARKR
jgi:hypothetical protein